MTESPSVAAGRGEPGVVKFIQQRDLLWIFPL